MAVTPLGETIRFAGTMELAGDDLRINHRRVNAILQAAPRYIADLNVSPEREATIWAGLRPCTPDGLPYIGRVPRYDNVILATGHGMLGISLAPITGKIVSQLSSTQQPSMNIAPLSVTRFIG